MKSDKRYVKNELNEEIVDDNGVCLVHGDGSWCTDV